MNMSSLVNAFGFWQAQPIENATHTYLDDIMQAFQHIQSIDKTIELWNGETGWPTDGNVMRLPHPHPTPPLTPLPPLQEDLIMALL